VTKKSNIVTSIDPRSETTIERDIRKVLDLFKLAYSKTNVARKRGKDGKFNQQQEGVRAGWPDYTSLLPPYGQIFVIEVKKVDGVVSKDQLEMKAKIERDGGIWLEARSAAVVYGFLAAHFFQHEDHPRMKGRINFSPKHQDGYEDT
jgi:hypothetical protein